MARDPVGGKGESQMRDALGKKRDEDKLDRANYPDVSEGIGRRRRSGEKCNSAGKGGTV